MRLSAKQGQIGRERLVSNFTTSLRQLGGATVPAGGFHFNERRHALRTITAFPSMFCASAKSCTANSKLSSV